MDAPQCLETLFVKREILPEAAVLQLCEAAKDVLLQEETLLELSSPLVVWKTICGDIHGQFYDLLKMFQTIEGNKAPTSTDTRYLFLGDYVDRGHHSVLTLSLILTLKVLKPNSVFLLRGNHESRQITRTYGFYDECLSLYPGQSGSLIWRSFCSVFDTLPLAALVDGKVFCVHGGISPSLRLDTVRSLDRFQELPCSGVMSDLMWSDPGDVDRWELNPRGAGYVFGKGAVDLFFALNQTNLIVRSHQLVNDGFQWMFDMKLVTIWSAPNYCYRCGNLATVAELLPREQCPRIIPFTQSEESAEQPSLTRRAPEYFL